MTPIRAPFERVLSLIKQEIADPTPNAEVIAELARIGQDTINKAQRTKRAGNITGNQYEAFAYGVFFNGTCYKQNLAKDRDFHENAEGKTVKGSEKDPKRGGYGWSKALHAVRDHKSTHRGYELFLTNAMWYSAIHEEWGIRILTQEIRQAASRIATTFNVEVIINLATYPRYPA